MDVTVGTFMLGDSIIYFHLDLSASVAAGRRARPLFVTALTRRALDWNIRVLKRGAGGGVGGGQAL